MEDIKNYIFYAILKDFSGNKLNETGISYGIPRGISTGHENYFTAFLNIDTLIWQDLCLNADWPTSLEIMASDGNVMIANSAPEIESITHRMYLIYLPDSPSLFQVLFLEHISEEFKDLSIEVGVYGEAREDFLKLRNQTNFNSHTFLKEYIEKHKKELENKKQQLRKVMQQ